MGLQAPQARMSIRLDADVYEMLTKAAEASGSTLISELNVRLRDSLVGAESPIELTTTEKVMKRVMLEVLREELAKEKPR